MPSIDAPGWVVIAATRSEAAGASLRVAGLTVIDRALRQLSDAAATRVVVASDGSVALPAALPANAEVRPVVDGAAAAELARALGAPLLGADVVRLQRAPLDGGLRVVDEPSRRAAEDAVFAALFRADLGLVARRLNKPISVRITRHFLVRTPITPNQITLFAAALGLLGCGLVATGRWAMVVAGFALAQIQSVLDGCDGELARVRFQSTKLGAWLDTMVDDVLNVLMTVAAGVGLTAAGAGTWALAVGLGSGAMLIVSNFVAVREMRRQGTGGDLMNMTWWFSGGQRLGEVAASADPATPAREPASRSGKKSGRAELISKIATHRAWGAEWLAALGTFLFQMGRRDSAILLWLLFAIFGQLVLVLVMAAVIALAWFGASLVQLVVQPAPPPRSAG